MNFSNEPQAKRQFIQTLQTVVHRPHIVDRFFNIFRDILPGGVNLELQDIFERALRTLDLRTENGLVAHVHCHEQVRVGQNGGAAIESTQRAIRVRQQAGEIVIHHDGRRGRQWRCNKRPIVARLFYISARTHNIICSIGFLFHFPEIQLVSLAFYFTILIFYKTS
jgi:hypothetical protein